MTLIDKLLSNVSNRNHCGESFYLFHHEQDYGNTTLQFYSMIDINNTELICMYFPVYGSINSRSNKQVAKTVERVNWYKYIKTYQQFTVRLAKRLDFVAQREVKVWVAPNCTYNQIINLSYKLNLGYHLTKGEIDYDLLFDPDANLGDYNDDNAWF